MGGLTISGIKTLTRRGALMIYDELNYFFKLEDILLNNNSQDRLMRNPVTGRKTWYGTNPRREQRPMRLCSH
jgi:hypothetical protein